MKTDIIIRPDDAVESVYDNDTVTFKMEIYDSIIFLHLDVHKWSAQILKFLRRELDKVLKVAYEQGQEYVFFYSNNEKTIRFANLLRPIDEDQVDFGEGYTLAAWKTIGD